MTPLSSSSEGITGTGGDGGGVGGTTSTSAMSISTSTPGPLQLNLRNHCLFCLQPQPPSEMIELIKSNPKKILTFQPILHYLTGSDPTFDKVIMMESCDAAADKKKRIPLMRNLPPLCQSCYDMVGELDRLHKQLLDVQWLIKKQVEVVRETLKKARVPPAHTRFKMVRSARLKFLGKLGGGGMPQEEVSMVRKFVDDLHEAIMEDSGSVLYPSKVPPNYVPTSDCPNTKSVHRIIIRNLNPPGPPGRKVPKHKNVDGDDGNRTGRASASGPGHATSSEPADSPMNDEEDSSSMDMDTHDDNQANDLTLTTMRPSISMSAMKAKSKPKPKYAKVRKRKRATIRRYVDGVSTAQLCDLCGQMIPIPDIVSHLETHVKGYVTKCINPACPYVFSCPLKMEKHIRMANPKYSACRKTANIPEGLWTKQCEACDFSTEFLRAFRIHLEGHEDQNQGKSFCCPIPNCEEKFTLRQTLEIHISHHDLRPQTTTDPSLAPTPVQQCPICKESISLDEMKTHLHEAHQATATFTCQLCPFVFPDEESQLKHIADAKHPTGKNTGFSCGICEGVKFLHRSTLLSHNRKVHGTPLNCQHCDQTFPSLPLLKEHLRQEHLGSNKNRRFPCTFENCGKVFTRSVTLRSHESASHSKVMPYICSSCGKAYLHRQSLEQHTKIAHLGLRHICDVCGVSFTTRDGLQNHLLKHNTGDKFHSCPVCQKAFLYKSMMLEHKRLYHKKEKKESELVKASTSATSGESPDPGEK